MPLVTKTRSVAAALCAGLLFASVTAAPVQAKDGQITAALAGVAALGLLAVAASSSQLSGENGKPVHPHHHPTSSPPPYKLPNYCLRPIPVDGAKQIYGGHCMHNRSVGELPKACHVAVTHHGKKVQGYLPHCMEKHGWYR